MPATCWSSVRAQVARITNLDNCGRPLAAAAPCGFVVTKGFVTINYSPQYEEGDPIRVTNAAGDICINSPAKPRLTGVNVEIQFCQVDPDLASMIAGMETVLDSSGEAVGNRLSESSSDDNWALEAWSQIPGAACDSGSDKPYGYFLLPWVSNGRLGDFSLANDAATFTYTGVTQPGAGWGAGPWDVDAGVGGTAGPLATPIGADDHLDMHLTTVAPPTPVCGCQPMPAA
jgi:hypothetical protein